MEKLKFAVLYGADAVYIGGQQYGLRAKAGNFTFEDMREGVAFAHERGAKVYVAANIMAHNEDFAGMADYFQMLQKVGIDAVIVADPAIVDVCREAAPGLEIHISTQASVTNWQAVQFWAEEGIPRVVLAREVSLQEICEIKRHVDIEIEAFVHGAMCISYSSTVRPVQPHDEPRRQSRRLRPIVPLEVRFVCGGRGRHASVICRG